MQNRLAFSAPGFAPFVYSHSEATQYCIRVILLIFFVLIHFPCSHFDIVDRADSSAVSFGIRTKIDLHIFVLPAVVMALWRSAKSRTTEIKKNSYYLHDSFDKKRRHRWDRQK